MSPSVAKLTSATPLLKDFVTHGRGVLFSRYDGFSSKLGAEAHVPLPIFHDFAAVGAFEISVCIGGVFESEVGADGRGEVTPVA